MRRILFPIAVLLAATTSAQAMSPGRYVQPLADGSTDILVVYQDNTMTLEHTRQVGGPGGISKEGVVPYPTVCRVQQSATILSENENTIEYQVKTVALADSSRLQGAENCDSYVLHFNALTYVHSFRFDLRKADFVPAN